MPIVQTKPNESKKLLIGGIYHLPDESVKINAEIKPQKLMTWDNIKIEGLEGAAIQGFEISCLAGDVLNMTVKYYNAKGDNIDRNMIHEETFFLQSLNLQSSSRVSAVNYEDKRI